MTNETNCANCGEEEKKPHKHILNADFAVIAVTIAALHSFLMVYSVVFLS
jgi:uncharacterized protein (DUF983 family)